MYDGWRYLGLDSERVLRMTPREFSILMRAQIERKYDEHEQMAGLAMMFRYANHAKKAKQSDLFKRPDGEEKARKTSEEIKAESEYTMKWLSQFEEFSGKEGVISNE